MPKKLISFALVSMVAVNIHTEAAIDYANKMSMEQNKVEKFDNRMTLTSPAFKNEGYLPKQSSCDGVGTHPPLTIHGAPTKTVSFALIMEDLNVPKSIRKDGLWIHWIVFNIPSSVTQIKVDKKIARHGISTGGYLKYEAPCPPKGNPPHHYHFNLYALDSMLTLPTGATKQQLLKAMTGHVIAKAVLISRYTIR